MITFLYLKGVIYERIRQQYITTNKRSAIRLPPVHFVEELTEKGVTHESMRDAIVSLANYVLGDPPPFGTGEILQHFSSIASIADITVGL